MPFLSKLCRALFFSQPMEIYVDDEAKLTLHGLVQHYIMLNEEEKNRKLNDLLDALDFNQVLPPHILWIFSTSPEEWSAGCSQVHACTRRWSSLLSR